MLLCSLVSPHCPTDPDINITTKDEEYSDSYAPNDLNLCCPHTPQFFFLLVAKFTRVNNIFASNPKISVHNRSSLVNLFFYMFWKFNILIYVKQDLARTFLKQFSTVFRNVYRQLV